MRELSSLEARVLGVLVEKERTVPDAYPMSLNALALGCNQKTSRNPIINASEAEIVAALESLKGLSLVIESSGGRVMRYAQNVRRVLQVPAESVFLLAMLMLRGPQTAAELRANCARLCRFSDVSAVEAFLEELAGRSSGALVQELPRQAGSRETRWIHLLCGAAAVTPVAANGDPAADLPVDLPDVVAEVRAVLASYERARASRDAQVLERFLWQSPKALQVEQGSARSGFEEIARHWSGVGQGAGAGSIAEASAERASTAGMAAAVRPEAPVDHEAAGSVEKEGPLLRRRQVTTYGRDFASTAIEVTGSSSAGAGWESQVWVRLPQGWRIVAVHASVAPAASG
jgi:uncharacterized protein YceH (UPF0502 family)